MCERGQGLSYFKCHKVYDQYLRASVAARVWLLVDFLQPLGIVIDQLEGSTYWPTSTKTSSLISWSACSSNGSVQPRGRHLKVVGLVFDQHFIVCDMDSVQYTVYLSSKTGADAVSHQTGIRRGHFCKTQRHDWVEKELSVHMSWLIW